MINEPRIYRHSAIRLMLVILLFGILGVGLLTTMGWTDYRILILFGGLFGTIFLTILYSMTTKTTISNEGISTQTVFSTKSLTWSEINRVSGRGNAIKLHNFDGDVTVAPNQQLPGYEEIVEWIGIKRPDLFNPLEYSEMKRGFGYAFGLVVLALLFIFGLVMFIGQLINSPDASMPFALILLGILIFAIFWMILSVPQSLTLDGMSLYLKYISREKILLADEIASIELRFTQTRNGKNYFVLLTQSNGKSLRISGLSPSLPIVFLVLKNWHKKNVPSGQTNQQN